MSFNLFRDPPKPEPRIVHRMNRYQREYAFVLLEVIGTCYTWKVRMPNGDERLYEVSRASQRALEKWAVDTMQYTDLPKNVECYARHEELPHGWRFDWRFKQL